MNSTKQQRKQQQLSHYHNIFLPIYILYKNVAHTFKTRRMEDTRWCTQKSKCVEWQQIKSYENVSAFFAPFRNTEKRTQSNENDSNERETERGKERWIEIGLILLCSLDFYFLTLDSFTCLVISYESIVICLSLHV